MALGKQPEKFELRDVGVLKFVDEDVAILIAQLVEKSLVIAKRFDGLQQLWQAYQDQGLVVLGFPSNEFGAQDPGSNDEIASFCQLNYGVSFPMMAKIDVNGPATHPLYAWLKGEKGSPVGTVRLTPGRPSRVSLVV